MGQQHPTEVADLAGARLVVSMEVGEGRALDEELVKQLTGGETLNARRMREDFWQFTPSHTLWLGCNHRPEIRGSDPAIWRRIKLVPFTVAIPEEEQDKALSRKLKEELPGVLAWAVRGCLAYQERGLDVPEDVVEATVGYREEMDVVGAFIDDRCDVGEGKSDEAGDLYKEYVEWCKESGERYPKAKRAFGLALKERGFKQDSNARPRRWLGLQVTPPGGRIESVPDLEEPEVELP